MDGKGPSLRAAPESGPGQANRIARSTAEVHALLLLLTVAYYFVFRSTLGGPEAWLLSAGTFGASVLAIRAAPPLAGRPKLRLAFEATAMVAFITVLMFLARGASGPLANLYLLPLVTTALVLGRRATLFQLGLILAGRLAVAAVMVGPGGPSVETGLALFAELSPILLVAFLTSALASDLNLATRRIRTLSERDDLTGLLNMRTFDRLAQEHHRVAERRGLAYAILMVDLDGLKKINGRFGHAAGDRALAAVADALARATRGSDHCARYGGDEFVVILPGAGRDAAEAIANRIRHNVFAATQDFDYAMRRLTVSIGCATYPEDGRDHAALVQAADRSMYLDKHARSTRQQAGMVVGGD